MRKVDKVDGVDKLIRNTKIKNGQRCLKQLWPFLYIKFSYILVFLVNSLTDQLVNHINAISPLLFLPWLLFLNDKYTCNGPLPFFIRRLYRFLPINKHTT